jgi:hypothetical protein
MTLRNFFVGRTVGFLIVIILVGGFFLVRQVYFTNNVQEHTVEYQTYSNADHHISFQYPENYVLSEMHPEDSSGNKHHVITLINKKDLPVPVGGEGPTSITIEMYDNDAKQSVEQWIRTSKESNFKLSSGNIATTTIDGTPALSYRWSGLYEGTTIVSAKHNQIYVFTVTYLEMGADIIQDFVVIRDSIKFIQ